MGPSFNTRNPRYELCPSDTFDIVFPYAPEFNTTVSVQPDGFITLTEIGDMHVAGKTVQELIRELTAAYGKILHDPVISITLKDFNKPYFTVGGEVSKPGKFDLRADTTVTEAIAIAGGFTASAKHSQVLLVRKVSDDWSEVKKVDVKTMLSKGQMHEDIHLRPGDLLYVPKNRLSKFKQFLPTSAVEATLPRF
jgi:polysaccharide export outer membrane protein